MTIDIEPEGIPEQHLGCIHLPVDLAIYSRSSIMHAAHKFTDKCFVTLQHDEQGHLLVEMVAKEQRGDMMSLAGNFYNELLDQSLRETVQKETEPLRALILAHALSETSLLHPELEREEPII